ncbi:MAG TPA: ATP-dependent zinc metalloprotease FtsH [Pirellulaceae bacterium]|nr:ATP-dependent zinc metalloprotease FtsH [Pirellulaceae bacterium]HMO92891.1 ATP-dependent zinc metalloprotease FtsH [Pirellulaceae bacterium]HMP69169.1 ATP-dependent zinc metalloprotease FtsH [Pirellulaceae bacterium]
MSQGPRDANPNDQNNRPFLRGINFWIFVLLVAILATWLWTSIFGSPSSVISISYLEKLIEGKDFNGLPLRDENGDPIKGSNIQLIRLGERHAEGLFVVRPPKEPYYDSRGELQTPKESERLYKNFTVYIEPPESNQRDRLIEALDRNSVNRSVLPESNLAAVYTFLFIALMVGILALMFFSMRRAQNQMLGGGGFLSNFSKSPAKRYEAAEMPITFKDVAGLEGVKADLNEIVEFLREPEKFRKLGGRVPKGVLLIGPPGTGKTLLARAVAGEANVPYFSVNGSEFIQMFVGVGASRVRDLFNTAKSQAPAIIFIDEIDAVGRQRGAGLGGGHDEREQTLNQILGEMDGFTKTDSVIILAATNRPDVLDPALLRPGRFDRHVTVSRPTQKGRFEIFKVHVRDVPLGDDVDLKVLAAATTGMTGADIQNMVNEAALWAARHNKTRVEMADFYYAHDKVLMGAKREEVMNPTEKTRTAYHEAGHTIAAWFLKGAYPVHKVTIIPRGQALGVTQMVPDEDRLNMSENEIKDQLVVLLSGRAAEKLIYREMTVGAENDLERATSLARKMVTHWGMSEKLGPVSYKTTEDDPFLGREMAKHRLFSEHTMEVIDEEVNKILVDASQKALNLLNDRRHELELVTKKLLDEEEIDRKLLTELIGPSVHDDKPHSTIDQLDVDSPNGQPNDQVRGTPKLSDVD